MDAMRFKLPELQGDSPGPLIVSEWSKPTHIEVRKVEGQEYLAWTFDDSVPRPRVEDTDQQWFCQMLLTFVSIGQKAAKTKHIITFAEKYGPLGIEVIKGKDLTGQAPAPGRHDWYYESVETWKKYAGIARAVLTLAGYLSSPEANEIAKQPWLQDVEPRKQRYIGDGSPEFGPYSDAWDVILRSDEGYKRGLRWAVTGGRAAAIAEARLYLADFITRLLDQCGVKPRLLWWLENCKFLLWYRPYTGGQIFGRIALMMGGTMGIALCSAPGCTALLRVTGPRSASKHAWCDEHKRTAAVREATRRYRQREAAKKKGKKGRPR
jgi:hypothetical protein